MKKLILILVFGVFFLSSACAQKYFGKTYTSTQVIDQFFDASDVTKGYTVMGKTELGKGFRSLEKTQEKIIDLARKKGADGVIFTMEEEVYATSNSGSGTVTQKKEKNATVFSNSTTTDLKEKKIRATFIKYK
jgi:hypothetical protein